MKQHFLILYVMYVNFAINIQENIKNDFYKTYLTLVCYTYLNVISNIM